MNLISRSVVAGMAAVAAAAAFVPRDVQAQQFPTKPIRVVVAGPAGGSADIAARILAEGLAPVLGQPVVVDDKPGAAGMIAVQDLLRAPRDGYTLLVAPGAMVSEIPHVIKTSVNTAKELRPVAEVATGGLLFVAAPQLQVDTVAQAVAYVKAHPGKVSFASYSPGTLSHTMGMALNREAGLDMVHAGYKGSPPALTDIMGGHVQFMFDGPATSLPMVQGGKLKALATTAPKRMTALPNVPTFAELGYKKLTETSNMLLWDTPNVPAAVQATVRAATLKVLAEPAVRAKILELGMEPGGTASPEELAKALQAASKRQVAALNAIGFKPE